MRSFVAAVQLFAGASLGFAANNPPEFIEKGIYPYRESGDCGRGYSEWQSWTNLPLFNAPHGKKVVGEIREGTMVVAKTGEVHSQVVPIQVVFARGPFKPGERVYYVSPYFGEGKRYLWKNGKRFPVPEGKILDKSAGQLCKDESQGCWAHLLEPRKFEWWVQFQIAKNRRGWGLVENPGQFHMGADACKEEHE
jgi:hypothetical protein